MLLAIPGLTDAARSRVEHAVGTLLDGPQLSMNVELHEDESLEDSLHTLLQGTLWAILMQAGADPDLERHIGGHGEVDSSISGARFLWFMCKKFFFTHNVAEKDGITIAHHMRHEYRIYDGHLFHGRENKIYLIQFSRARIPRVIRVVMDQTESYQIVGVTPHGLYGWGFNDYCQLGFKSTGYSAVPRRLTFEGCSEVQQYEQQLPPWNKDRLVIQISMTAVRTFILTPVGFVATGVGLQQFLPDNRITYKAFNPVHLPNHFIPSRVMDFRYVTIIPSGQGQMITGENTLGQLGLGHTRSVTGFQSSPHRFDEVLQCTPFYNIFLQGAAVLFAGKVCNIMVNSGLLPGGVSDQDIVSDPLRLIMPAGLSRFLFHFDPKVQLIHALAYGGETHVHWWRGWHAKQATAPFEASAVIFPHLKPGELRLYLRDGDGSWRKLNLMKPGKCAQCDGVIHRMKSFKVHELHDMPPPGEGRG
ncbi:Chromosome partition protein Smc [Carpediemonas membranifera]|uniref:Chromosome partition protein Smc n=1 Tax=Carpediemonas membranifera TaxID=201153 RepID=A0A8J6B0T4_9EUKA|nr:Chromosome partition protein Smc [Carpediemonas membranifera]|eukprot:KAG9393138.1 Chromosome partition protein Smc [Carpediemonas membranifera]